MSSSPGRLDGPGLPLRGAVWPCCSWEVKKLLRNREKGGVCVPFPGWGFIQAAPTPGMCEEGEGAAPRCLQAGGGTSGQVLALLTWEVLQDGKGKEFGLKALESEVLGRLLGTGSFLFPFCVSPALAPSGAVSPAVQAALGPFVCQGAEGDVSPGAGFAQPGLTVAALGSHPGGLDRGEEQCNMIHTWEQKITCICHCFHVYNVEKILERRILTLLEEKGEKKIVW